MRSLRCLVEYGLRRNVAVSDPRSLRHEVVKRPLPHLLHADRPPMRRRVDGNAFVVLVHLKCGD
jgi:hypothetical protein